MNIGAFVAIQLATQLAARESKLIKRMQDAGATSPDCAISLRFDSADDEGAFARLLKRGRVVENDSGCYYLSAPPDTSNQQRVVLAVVFLLVGLMVALLVFLMARPDRSI